MKREIRDPFARIGPRSVAVVSGLYVTIPNFFWDRETSVAEPAELTHRRGFLA
jgi:hypothetical protein